jgi:hypothetical protein
MTRIKVAHDPQLYLLAATACVGSLAATGVCVLATPVPDVVDIVMLCYAMSAIFSLFAILVQPRGLPTYVLASTIMVATLLMTAIAIFSAGILLVPLDVLWIWVFAMLSR